MDNFDFNVVTEMDNFDFPEWKEQNNKILEKYHHRVIFVPATDWMPYEHLDVCARLDDWLARKSKDGDGVKITLSADEVDAVRVALVIYKNVLEDIHREKLKKELKMVIDKAIMEAETETTEK